MKLRHIRNATVVIESGEHFILVDPMLGPKGSMPTFTYFRYKARRKSGGGPASEYAVITRKVNHCLITHKHPDHIDPVAEQFLKDKGIPVTCSQLDQALFERKG